MKKILKSISIVMYCSCLQMQVFGMTYSPPTSDIYTQAIAKLSSDVGGYVANLGNNSNQNIVQLLNSIFVNTPSVLDLKLNQTILNFLQTYTLRKDFSSIDLATPDTLEATNLKILLAKEMGYNTQRSILDKINDTKWLLVTPFEGASNDFNSATVNPGAPLMYTPYKNLAENLLIPIVQNNEAPTVEDLIGVDAYPNDAAKNKAKLFISYVLQTVDLPKNFIIPDPNTATNDPSNQASQVVYMYLPSSDKTAGTPYTTKKISVNADPSKYANAPQGESKVEYERMANFLKSNTQYYQPYKTKVRAASVLRTLYTDALYRSFQERVKDTSTSPAGQSMAEKEKSMAMAGLDKNYYETLVNGDPQNKISPATLADLAIEGLKTFNKLIYFAYRIHQGIERLNMLVAISGMQMGGMTGIQDDMNFVQPITKLIKNNCWDMSVPNLLTQDQQSVCNDPTKIDAAAMASGGGMP
jgi:hypothetical protein